MNNTRDRAWRRAKNKTNSSRKHQTIRFQNIFSAKKNWKQMYGRSEKMIRAAQLGMEYPKVSNIQLVRKGLDEILSNE
ncbi:hypothetical protein [Providencia burhodogranariea]|uniref:Uncharacterized protein n=1 Tax=Providencia burhodogranariea DSM 19968 TaxID=1141662 RepID=K8WQ70_9GAMM|nr:hypothetical protein OOA_13117 [Providencia burhodogranariea DSM 19968]